MGEDENNPGDHQERFLELNRKMLDALSPDEREEYDFHLRFRESIAAYQEKLDALPPETRIRLEGKLRENLAAGEKEQEALLDDDKRFSYEGLHAMRKFQNEHAKSLVDDAYSKNRAEKLRDDLKAKMAAGKQQDHDRER